MLRCIAFSLFTFMFFTGHRGNALSPAGELLIRKTTDFEISGNGSAKNWASAQWIAIPLRTATGVVYETKVKLLYSGSGMYFLFSCQDKKLSNTMQSDFLDLWNEDVIEIFLQPDATRPAYFEYELSPLNYELPIIIFNEKGKLNSWIPFHYEDDRKTKHATSVTGGERKTNAMVSGWTTEVFVPYQLLKPILNTLPSSGTEWKGNLYRIDYDKGETLWSWQLNSGNFHEYNKFGSFRFE